MPSFILSWAELGFRMSRYARSSAAADADSYGLHKTRTRTETVSSLKKINGIFHFIAYLVRV